MPTLASLGEFAFLRRLLPQLPRGRDVLLGPGDDCAVVHARAGAWLVTVDALVEHVHFRRGWLTPAALGRRAFAVNASDIAAMGGTPRWCVTHIGAPARTAVTELDAIARGVASAAAAAGAAVVGGNLSRAAELSVTVTLIGSAPPRPLTRAGARPGDAIYVTGTLGDAALGVRLLRRDRAARGAAVTRFRRPTARLAAGALLARRRIASAMIDISDGLMQDLAHLCAASRVGARIEPTRVPCRAAVRRAGLDLALAGGEDYELLFTVAPRHAAALARHSAALGCRITRIGVCTAPRDGLQLVDTSGSTAAWRGSGHDHFKR
ncbi:MAG: thiamine-phosphate kinase [Deltaproteobacteria bacterium]|nr:thiamine-phosphate kinase [Deltaproteobacteria bacterium]